MSTLRPIPEGYHSLTPYLAVRGAAKAMDFYRRAFGAEEVVRMAAPDGSVMHGEMRIGDSMFMLGEAAPERGAHAPQDFSPVGSPVGVLIYTDDVDALFARAVEAGAEVEEAPQDMFWGDRYGKLVDPFGHRWSIATHVEDVSPEEMGKRMQAMFAGA